MELSRTAAALYECLFAFCISNPPSDFFCWFLVLLSSTSVVIVVIPQKGGSFYIKFHVLNGKSYLNLCNVNEKNEVIIIIDCCLSCFLYITDLIYFK